MTGARGRARSLVEVGRYADAERVVRAGLAEAPDDGPLLILLASVQRLQRAYREALSTVEAAVAASPHDAEAHAEHAEILIALIRSAEAITAAREAVRLDPYDAGCHFVLARALTATHTTGEARAAAEHGLRLSPRSVEGLLTLAEVEREARDRDAARAAARSALAVDPDNAYGRWLIAMLDAEKLRVRRSMRALREVARDDPGHADIVSMTWPIRGVLLGLRRGLAATAGLICVLLLVALRWEPMGMFARIAGGALAAVLAVFALCVLLPAGRLPWRCLRLLPPIMLRADVASLTLAGSGVLLLGGYAATGWWSLPVLALALTPVLWLLGYAELLGAGLDDPGTRSALTDLGGEFRDWWTTTKRELRDVWRDDKSP